AGLRRRSRMIALEPRMLFDGALGIDLTAKATAALQGDSSASTDNTTATPATPEPQQRTAAEKSVEKPAEKTGEKALDQQIESLADRPGAEPKELVFIDTSVQDYQALLKNVNPNAIVVVLDPTRDAF